MTLASLASIGLVAVALAAAAAADAQAQALALAIAGFAAPFIAEFLFGRALKLDGRKAWWASQAIALVLATGALAYTGAFADAPKDPAELFAWLAGRETVVWSISQLVFSNVSGAVRKVAGT